LQKFGIKRVERLGAVQRDDRDSAFVLHDDILVFHFQSPKALALLSRGNAIIGKKNSIFLRFRS
jgi:hypothetical protein